MRYENLAERVDGDAYGGSHEHQLNEPRYELAREPAGDPDQPAGEVKDGHVSGGHTPQPARQVRVSIQIAGPVAQVAMTPLPKQFRRHLAPPFAPLAIQLDHHRQAAD